MTRTWARPAATGDGELCVRLATDHRVPQLIIEWPAIAGAEAAWHDVAGYGFDELRRAGSAARRVVADALGDAMLAEVLAAIEALGEVATEEVGHDVRAWWRTIERGFCPGDLVDVDGLTVDAAGVVVEGYSHSYGDQQGTPHRLSAAELLDPGCAVRATFAECLPRIDAYLRARG